MAEKVYTPETITDTPFPTEDVESLTISQSTSNDTYSNETIKDQPIPDKRISHEVISSALNTKSKKILQEFEFTKSGAIQIGEYEDGVSGDIKISPSGIVGRNTSGQTTFAIDGETGDATFAGTIQTGALIAGDVIVGDNDIVISGGDYPGFILYNDGVPEIFIGSI